MDRTVMIIMILLAVMLWPLNASPLSDLAQSLQPGEWGELETIGFNGGDILRAGNGVSILDYTDEAQWDPVNRKIYIIGTSTGYGHGNQEWIQYAEDSNTWVTLPKPSFYIGWHSYDHAAMDQSRGEYYVATTGGDAVYKYSTAARTWTQLPGLPTQDGVTCCTGVEYFQEIDRLVYINPTRNNGEFYLYNPILNNWITAPGGLRAGNIHLFSEYDDVNKVLYYGGGSGNQYAFNRLDASGNTEKLADAPVKVGIEGDCPVHSVDPVSGNFLVFSTNGKTYEYTPSENSWDEIGDHPLDWAYTMSTACAKIPEYGVLFFARNAGGSSKVLLYRHSSGTSANSRSGVAVLNTRLRAFPNPAVGTVKVGIDLPVRAGVKLAIYNAEGRLVKRLVNKVFSKGSHSFIWKKALAGPGVYVVSLNTGQHRITRKVLLLK